MAEEELWRWYTAVGRGGSVASLPSYNEFFSFRWRESDHLHPSDFGVVRIGPLLPSHRFRLERADDVPPPLSLRHRASPRICQRTTGGGPHAELRPEFATKISQLRASLLGPADADTAPPPAGGWRAARARPKRVCGAAASGAALGALARAYVRASNDGAVMSIADAWAAASGTPPHHVRSERCASGGDPQVALGADGEPAVGDEELLEDDEVVAAATHDIQFS